MLIRQNRNKGFTLVEIMIVVVIIGLLAAMAIPAFQTVRDNAREKSILNNLRLIWSSGQQFLLDNPSETEATVTNLQENGYFDTIEPVGGESYGDISITAASKSIDTKFTASEGERTVTYPPTANSGSEETTTQ